MMEDASIKKIAHNWKFDAMWMIDALEDLPYARGLYDTLLLSQLAGRYKTQDGAKKAGKPTAWEPNDLAACLHRFLGVTISKTIDHDTVDWAGEWSREMVEYMLEDIEYLEPLCERLEVILREQGQERAARIECDAVFATAHMTLNGVKPDIEAWRAAILDWKEEEKSLLAELKLLMPGVQNFASQPQLMREIPKVIGAPILNTRKETLKLLAPHFYEIKVLMKLRSVQTRLKNWGPGNPKTGKPDFLTAHVCRICLRFHPEWRQIGTETSRYSCSKPNLQQIPRAPEFRRLFIAEEGFWLSSCDYSAIEVVTAAVFANCKNLLEACATGDPHRSAAARMAHKLFEEVTSDERQSGKIANFGLLFGGGPDGYVRQARDLFEVDLSREQAQQDIAAYYAAFPELRHSRNRAYRAMEQEGEVWVSNAVGFRRILEGNNRKPTSWLNTWIQSTAGYGLKVALRYIMEAGLLPFLVMQVHDELVFEFPEEDVHDFTDIVLRCMLRGMYEVLGKNAPVTVKPEKGLVWL